MTSTSPSSSGGSPTPPPGGGGPSPLVIGRTFLKQYYQVLSSDNPENIIKFYKPVSVVSHGEGSEITNPVTLETLGPSGLLQDRLFSSSDFRLELEHGAIDAQQSVGGGILVVVTGHMYLSEKRRAFCHTFFLNPAHQGEGQRKQYYVHNDVLRFLFEENGKEPTATEEAPAADDGKAVAAEEEEEKKAVEPAVVETEEQPVMESEDEMPVQVVLESEPGSSVETNETTAANETPAETIVDLREPAVEESNEEAVEETKNGSDEPTKDETKPQRRKSKSRKDGRRKSPSPTNSAPKPAAKSSWASLVASGGGDTPQSMSPVRPLKASEKASTKKESPPKETAKSAATDGGKDRPKRDPECTIVIKNVTSNMKEGAVRKLFLPFAKETNSKIMGINISASRGLGFVDFDSPVPVLLALERKDQLLLEGRVLDVEHKIAVMDSRSSHRGSRARRRSGSPKDKAGGAGGRSSSSRKGGSVERASSGGGKGGKNNK